MRAPDEEIAEMIGEMVDDPLRFVQVIFPWGEEHTDSGEQNVLYRQKGPEIWQCEYLDKMGEHIKENDRRKSKGQEIIPWRSAVASGHGVGKSALSSWLIYFLMSTRKYTRGVVTASTQFQLEDKTWPELAKWHRLALNNHWFTWSATRFTYALGPEESRKNYMTTAATVSEHRTEAFAGLHNYGNTVFVLFDEASGVMSPIWVVAEGVLTDGESFFMVKGNPTRSEGEFFDCFGRHEHLYFTMKVDSRDVSFSNKTAINIQLEKFGRDSDEAKVRVYGDFPTQSHTGFISKEFVDTAMNRGDAPDPGASLIMAIDVGRTGSSETVMGFRQGKDNRSFPLRRYRHLDNVEVAELAAELANEVKPDVIVIEAPGPGSGVIDLLRFRGYMVEEVYPGANAKNRGKFANRRAEMWAKMREWLMAGGVLPKDGELASQILSMDYGYDKSGSRLLMESKELRKKTKKPSPDWADMLALTFAITIPRRDLRGAFTFGQVQAAKMAIIDNDPLGLNSRMQGEGEESFYRG